MYPCVFYWVHIRNTADEENVESGLNMSHFVCLLGESATAPSPSRGHMTRTGPSHYSVLHLTAQGVDQNKIVPPKTSQRRR